MAGSCDGRIAARIGPVLFGIPVERVAELDTDELGYVLLDQLRGQDDDFRAWDMLAGIQSRWDTSGYRPELQEPVLDAITEAWAWLRQQGFLAPSRKHDGYERLTKAGREVGPTYVIELRSLGLLRGARLDPQLAAQVLPLMRKGQYGTAVFAAMRQVEIGVRDAAKIDVDVPGVPMMRQAFKIGGPLDDPSMVASEREGRSALFAGAIGVLKNPPSHRLIDVDDAQEAAEAILMANLLLRIAARARTAAAKRAEVLQKELALEAAAAVVVGGAKIVAEGVRAVRRRAR